MKNFFILLFISGLASAVYSGPIFEEYTQIEREKRIEKNNNIKQKNQLKKTLLSSLKLTMLKFFDYPEHEKISIADFSYETTEEAKLTYYVKYKDYLGYFVYNNDPGQYFLTPVEVKFVSKPGVKIAPRSSIIEEGLDKQKTVSKTNSQPENPPKK